MLRYLPLIVLLALTNAQASSVLRIACDDDAAGADISVNGVFKGDCPIDVQLPAGTYQVSAVLKVGAQVRDFAQEVRLGDGVAKKLSVQLSPPHMTAEAQRQEKDRQAREAAERQRQEAAERARQEGERQARETAQRQRQEQERQRLQAERKENEQRQLGERQANDRLRVATLSEQAARGDNDALRALAEHYEQGKGVASDRLKARELLGQAARRGDEVAELKLADASVVATANEVRDMLQVLSLPRGELRRIERSGEAELRALIAADPFFALPGASQSAEESFAVDGERPTENQQVKLRAVRQGNVHLVTGTVSREGDYALDEVVALGGLLSLKRTEQPSDPSAQPAQRNTLRKIEAVAGQPYPLAPGKRFSLHVQMQENQNLVSYHITCGATDPTQLSRGVGARLGNGVTPLICYIRSPYAGRIQRYYWAQASGYAYHPAQFNGNR